MFEPQRRAGVRGHGWRADVPATLYWAEAQDGGDPRRPAPVRDRVFILFIGLVEAG